MSETYLEIMRSNLRPMIEEKTEMPLYRVALKSITTRQLFRIIQGEADVTVGRLEDIADELKIDFPDLFVEYDWDKS